MSRIHKERTTRIEKPERRGRNQSNGTQHDEDDLEEYDVTEVDVEVPTRSDWKPYRDFETRKTAKNATKLTNHHTKNTSDEEDDNLSHVSDRPEHRRKLSTKLRHFDKRQSSAPLRSKRNGRRRRLSPNVPMTEDEHNMENESSNEYEKMRRLPSRSTGLAEHERSQYSNSSSEDMFASTDINEENFEMRIPPKKSFKKLRSRLSRQTNNSYNWPKITRRRDSSTQPSSSDSYTLRTPVRADRNVLKQPNCLNSFIRNEMADKTRHKYYSQTPQIPRLYDCMKPYIGKKQSISESCSSQTTEDAVQDLITPLKNLKSRFKKSSLGDSTLNGSWKSNEQARGFSPTSCLTNSPTNCSAKIIGSNITVNVDNANFGEIRHESKQDLRMGLMIDDRPVEFKYHLTIRGPNPKPKVEFQRLLVDGKTIWESKSAGVRRPKISSVCVTGIRRYNTFDH